MKFGSLFATKLYQDWRFYYLDYDHLKRLLKEKTMDKEFNEYDEAAFVELLDNEIEKVVDFKELKGGELERRIKYYESGIQGMDLKKLTDKALAQLHIEIEKITQELSQLGKFCRLNYTAILKILKKHDKYTKLLLRPTYLVRFNTNPIYFESLDRMIYRLSKLYNILSTKGECLESSSPRPGGDAAQSFTRRTTKYWVHPDNVTDVKIMILKNLPVLVYQSKKENFDQAISSIYLDNDNMELYTGRIEKTEGAQAIRIRWYGSEEPNEVFIERKIHREDWTGEISVKSRFSLKEKHVNNFLSGEYTLDKTIGKLRASGRKTEEELEEFETLSKDIQKFICEKKLRPFLRTFYHRTAFQLPGDASVRISLDTELTMIKEAGHADLEKDWKRKDVGCNYPFQDLGSNEIVRFPYAILEVKLQTQAGQDPPKWVTQLINGPLVEEVPKFSKFVHGCAVLFENRVSLFPFWLPQMNVDIRKNNTPTESIAKSIQSEAANTYVLSPVQERQGQVEIDIWKSNDEEKRPLLEEHRNTEREEPNTDTGRRKDKFAVLRNLFKRRKRGNGINTPTNNKRIAIPVRIEPKVFFANERTFLSWLHFSIFLGGIATALVGLGDKSAKISGYIFSTVSVLFAFYALYLYQWRAHKIRQRDPGPYDDLVGPTMLVVVFLAAMVLNFVFSGIFETRP